MSGWVAGAVVAGGVISAVGSNMAAGQQANAAQNSQNIQQGMFNTTVANEQSYMNAGEQAQGKLNYLLGIGPQASGATSGNGYNSQSGYGIGAGGSIYQGLTTGGTGSNPNPDSSSPAGGYGSLLTPFTASNFHDMSPAYQFQLQQGQQGVLNTDSGSQGALSGAALKDLTGYNQGMANTSFNNAFNQYQTQQGNIYSRLASVAQTGQAAASNQATGASNFGSSIGQSATNVGSALGGGTVGAGNALSGGASSLGGIYAAYGGGGQFDPSGVGSLSSLSQSDLPNASMYLNNDIAVSDRRLKKNIRRIGQTEGGQPWYEFEYIDKPGLHTGVMADESPPEAVSYSADGYAMVDYLRIR